jgi:hypothetical protein
MPTNPPLDGDGIECAASALIKRFGVTAAGYAREQAEISDERHHDQLSAETWRDIAAAIEASLSANFRRSNVGQQSGADR